MTQNEFDAAIKALADDVISANIKWLAGLAEMINKAEAAELDMLRCLSTVKTEAKRVETAADDS